LTDAERLFGISQPLPTTSRLFTGRRDVVHAQACRALRRLDIADSAPPAVLAEPHYEGIGRLVVTEEVDVRVAARLDRTVTLLLCILLGSEVWEKRDSRVRPVGKP
jgi:hypothetical protein